MSKGSVVFVAIVVACASSGTEPVVPEDAWTRHASRRGLLLPGEPVRCEKGIWVPACESKPPPAELSPIDRTLADKVGEEVTVAARPTNPLTCQKAACMTDDGRYVCCNACWGPVLLCGADPERWTAIAIGSCSGDECTTCCSLVVREDRVMVARGVLARTDVQLRDYPRHLNFALEDPEYCYLEDEP